MSTPILFIALPFLLSVVLFVFQKKEHLVKICGIGLCVFLAAFAIFQEFGQVLKVGTLSIEIGTSINLLGRSLVLMNNDRFFLAFVYLSLAIFSGVTTKTGITVRFIPVGIAIVSILACALAVEPFIYSAILVEIAVIVSIPLMIQKGTAVGKGVLRFLIYQTLAALLILYGGWLLGGIQASTSDSSRLLQAAILLGIGFAFWLAIFPFQSWVPQLCTDIHPLLSGFILGILPLVTLLIMVDFISGLVWIRESQVLSPILRIVGTIMIVLSGLWSAQEKDIRRMIGFAVIYETGLSLILISAQSEISIRTLYISFVPRILALALMVFSISILAKNQNSYQISILRGSLRKAPFSAIAFLVSLLSIAGFPIFAGFPVHLSAIQQVGLSYPKYTIWIIIGVMAFILSIVRFFSILSSPTSEKWYVSESIDEIIYLIIGIVVLLLLGMIPNIFGESIAVFFLNLPVLR